MEGTGTELVTASPDFKFSGCEGIWDVTLFVDSPFEADISPFATNELKRLEIGLEASFTTCEVSVDALSIGDEGGSGSDGDGSSTFVRDNLTIVDGLSTDGGPTEDSP